MYKNNILNVFLFIVVISLASIIYFSEEKNTELERLSTIKKSDISSIVIQHNQNTTAIVKQGGELWFITQPVKISANNFRINSVLKLINTPVHNRYSIEEINLNNVGLDKPSTTIKFDELFIEFGIINPATNLRYIRLGDYIYTIEDVYYPLLSSNFGTLVSLDLLPANSQIEKLILVNQTISRNDKKFWQSNIDISADNINKAIDHWKNAQAFGVHKYLQRNTLGEVFIYFDKQQQPVSYIITDTDPWLILARPELDLEYHLDIESYDSLLAPQ